MSDHPIMRSPPPPEMPGLLRRCARWALRSWLHEWFAMALVLLAVLSLYQWDYISIWHGASASQCGAQSLLTFHTPATCVDVLRGSLLLPDAAIWLDDLFVVAYSMVFLLTYVDAHARQTPGHIPRSGAADWLLGCAVALVLAGAACDWAENFWLLAHLEETAQQLGTEPGFVAGFTAWKCRFFCFNALVTAAVHLRERRRLMAEPHAAS